MLDSAAPEERREQVADETRKRIESDGSLKQADTWGTRKLAFEIEQQTEADYRFYRFEGEGELLRQLDHTLKITDGVLRFRIFKVEPGVPASAPPPTAQPAAVSQRAARAEARRAAPDEAAEEVAPAEGEPEAAEPAPAAEAPAEPAEPAEPAVPAEPAEPEPAADAEPAPAAEAPEPAQPTEPDPEQQPG